MSDGVSGRRGRRGPSFTLLTPANHYASRLPSLPGTKVTKLVTPRLAPARFAQYLLDTPESGAACAVTPGFEHFIFVLGGQASVTADGGQLPLEAGSFAYVPDGSPITLATPAGVAGRVLWIKRRYEPWAGLAPPAARSGHLGSVQATVTAVPGLTRRELLDPDDPAFDFNMSVMSFAGGVGLPQIEIHDEEHGLYMLSGAGDYQLESEQHPVEADDFIYMAPYCPQGFQADAGGASYLLYKDVYRDGF